MIRVAFIGLGFWLVHVGWNRLRLCLDGDDWE
jgi:hypothetical protein